MPTKAQMVDPMVALTVAQGEGVAKAAPVGLVVTSAEAGSVAVPLAVAMADRRWLERSLW